MEKCNLSETGRNKVELVFNILGYSDISEHIQELSTDIQAHSEACVTLVYSEPWNIEDPGIFRILTSSKPWHIQNPRILRNQSYSAPCYIQNAGIFRTLVYSEPWNIQNPGIFRTLRYLKTWYIEKLKDIHNPFKHL